MGRHIDIKMIVIKKKQFLLYSHSLVHRAIWGKYVDTMSSQRGGLPAESFYCGFPGKEWARQSKQAKKQT